MMHAEQISRPTGFQKSSELSSVSEDRKFSLGEEEVVGILVVVLGVAIGVGLAWGSNATSEQDLVRTSCCCLGWIALQVPVS